MDVQWLKNIDNQTAVVVPTRSLASTLREIAAEQYRSADALVWETPNIITWSDYLQTLWRANRASVGVVCAAHTVISEQQALLLWTKVIEESRRDERELTLLNVQQTARAVQRSWRMMHDWQISEQQVAKDHVADSAQFVRWVTAYRNALHKRNLIDSSLLAQGLLDAEVVQPFGQLVWYAFDLVTNLQRRLMSQAESQGLLVQFKELSETPEGGPSAEHKYGLYQQRDDELRSALTQARDLIEAEPQSVINIVVADLQITHPQVRELAREVFYPSLSPLQAQQADLVYRFSLGEALNRWPAIETALALVSLLKKRVTFADFSFLMRNQFLRSSKQFREQSREFESWLQRQRIGTISLHALPELYAQCLQKMADQGRAKQPSADSTSVEHTEYAEFLDKLVARLDAIDQALVEQKQAGGYAVFSFVKWCELISEWLSFWGWSTAVAADQLGSVQFQLQQRWQQLLEEFAGLETVQRQAGLNRAYEILQQMTRDAVFLPKAASSPILISGVYEAIGRPVDLTLLTGMDDRYPSAVVNDPFLANHLRQVPEFPGTSSKAHFEQSQRVISSLLVGTKAAVISYAEHDSAEEGVERGVSALFRHKEFDDLQTTPEPKPAMAIVDLERYADIQGPAWQDPKKVRGGSAIFENQSNCAFKAFVTHQLGFADDGEAEFGLDAMDRGGIVHELLDRVWAELQTQNRLQQLIQNNELSEFVARLVNSVLSDPELRLQAEKKQLLQHEQTRLARVLQEWLMVDAERPTPFSVVEREEGRRAEFAGIGFYYIIDRLDLLDDGRTAIIDYKTGTVAKRDWQGERVRRPQLPLYAVALDQVKGQPVSGIAYARVKQYQSAYEELAEVNIFKKASKPNITNEEKWHESRSAWPLIFEQLGQDFLAGKAEVNPLDDATCSYCKLQSVCRISQLKRQNSVTQDTVNSVEQGS